MDVLKILQSELAKLWTDELYSQQFKNSPSKYKDFDHALKHVFKAATKLLEMIEEADHGPLLFDRSSVMKYVADLLICSIRLANVSPTGVFSIEQAVLERIEKKMGMRIRKPVVYRKQKSMRRRRR